MTAHAIGRDTESRAVPAAVAACVLAGAAVAWVVLTHRMAGMDLGPGGDPGALGWFTVSWVVMTAAMMLPGSAPAVAHVVRGRRAAAPVTAVAFVTAYGAVWLLAGLAGYACVQAVRGLDAAALGWTSAGRYVAGAALIGAGLYQLTATKRRWLARCVAREAHLPHPGVTGALHAGARHGVCCVACCWTLMVALYALGIMSITWMVVLTVLIAGERLVGRPSVAQPAVAAVLVALGLGVAAAPASVPGLTIPAAGHPGAMGMSGGMTSPHTMRRSGGMTSPHTMGRSTHDH
jgi:Predicted metal-binding integral membrane protein (DUF2182)